MNSKKKKLLVVFLSWIIIALVLYLILKTIVIVVISAIVAAIVAVIVTRALDKNEAADESDKPPTPQPKTNVEKLEQELLELNIKIRVESFTVKVLNSIETIIDKIGDLLSELNAKYAGSDLTWVVNEMAHKYLPDVTNQYVSLGINERAQKETQILETLSGLNTKLDDINKLVSEQKVSEFDAEAKFLKIKFFS